MTRGMRPSPKQDFANQTRTSRLSFIQIFWIRGHPFPAKRLGEAMALANSSRAGGSRPPQAVAAKPGFSLGSAWRIASVRWIICIGLLTTAAIIAAGGYAVSDLRQNALKNAERELQNVASVIAEQFERMFEALTLTQLGVVRDIQMLDIRTAEEFERRLAKDDIHQELRKKIANLLPVRE